jgi:hypothetical protein
LAITRGSLGIRVRQTRSHIRNALESETGDQVGSFTEEKLPMTPSLWMAVKEVNSLSLAKLSAAPAIWYSLS